VLFELQDCETQAVEHLGDRAYCYLRSNMGELVVLALDVDSSFHGRLTLAIDVSALHFFDSREAAIKFE
jgi:ABC-type sugar transport system ATPase subunit